MKLTKKKIVDYLKEKNLYNSLDDFLIDELLYNIHLAKLAKEDLEDRGVVVAINSAGTLFNSNPSVNIYMSSVKMMLNIGRKLSLEPLIRSTMKLNDTEVDDGFDA